MWSRCIVMDSKYSNDSTLRPEVRSTRQETTKGRKMAERKIKRVNPFSGQSEMLTDEEAVLHDSVKQAEQTGDWNKMQKDLDKFSRLNPKAYMTLLD